MDTLSRLKGINTDKGFSHIPDWYNWEREEVRKEVVAGTYRFEDDVRVEDYYSSKVGCMEVGSAHVVHDENGFTLTGCDGKLNYSQGPLTCYSLYADYFWYEIGDVICIGNKDALYYCFPKNCGDVVAKARIATEELYKLKKHRKPKAE
jgi:hypothetical protein